MHPLRLRVLPFLFSRGMGSTWQRGLQHYQKAIVECGSSMGLEHAQRVALLFLKSEKNHQLLKWAKLFNSEGIPTCSLVLKALVKHDLWRFAISLWCNGVNATLSDALVEELMSKSLWRQSLLVVERLLESGPCVIDDSKYVPLSDLRELKSIPDGSELALNDGFRLSYDAAFMPPEESRNTSGLAHVVSEVFPVRSQWQTAVTILVSLSEQSVSEKTHKQLLELAAAKAVYFGERLDDSFLWIMNCSFACNSRFLQRTLFRISVLRGFWKEAIFALEKLSFFDTEEIPSLCLHDFCLGFIKDYESGECTELLEKFIFAISRSISRVQSVTVLDEVLSFFVRVGADAAILKGEHLLVNNKRKTIKHDMCFNKKLVRSISDIDNTASLLNRRQWKFALSLLKKMAETEPISDREKILSRAARLSLDNWETGLMFFFD
uniref:Uncharacterized protein n=1 Tax=Trypanosoma vivax (strain Y486) TaxID=1055687 RepID=G0U845_TRYVY|nr:conserved hypothetical protein [Trypanosoma vivax Y486]